MTNNQLNTRDDSSIVNAEHLTIVSTMPLKKDSANHLAEGHKIVRQKWNGDLKKIYFDSKAASRFRNYMANTILSTASNKKGIGYNSSDYHDAIGSIQFFVNGTFAEALSSHVGITAEGTNTYSPDVEYMSGYWEVAALTNGLLIILMYSTHPKMLEEYPSGFLPFVVAEHTVDFVAMPGGAGYHRKKNHHANQSELLI